MIGGKTLVRKSRQKEPSLEVKDFTIDEINRGIEKLKRRISDVQALDPQKVRFDDTAVDNIEQRIRETIREIFGPQSPEFRDHEHHRIWHGDYNVMDSEATRQSKFNDGIPQTIKMLEGLISCLEEKRAEISIDPTAHARTTFKGMVFHPRIVDVCRNLYLNGHYADAVFNASKALINFVKEKSGKHDLDGVDLMRTVFSRNNPILVFNNLNDQSDKDEQEGMMHLFEGVVLAIRNPRGHSFLYDSPERALEYICLLNLLANRLEEAKRSK